MAFPLLLTTLTVLTPSLLLGEAAGGPDGGFNPLSLGLFIGLGLMAYFLFVLPQKATNKKYQDMIDGIKENDHVVTTGGLHGVVTGVQRDQGRLTLRIDESSGAKVRVALWAIDSVLNDEK